MKTILGVLSLVAWLPTVASAQTLGLNLRLPLGPLSLRASVGNEGLVVRAAPGAGPLTPVATGGGTASAARVLATADRYVGTRYRYGGETPAAGFDCSGFVQFVFGRHGVELPRTSRQQAFAGRPLSPGLDALRAGDLMLFASRGGRVDHVAIYAGDGRILHSSASGAGVGYDDLSSPRGRWFLARHVASRRVL